jgi:hypothetical protein
MKILLAVLIVVVAGFAGFAWLTLHWSYSEGERAGFVQKFSREGEMALDAAGHHRREVRLHGAR